MPTEVERTFIPTSLPTAGFGIDIALECRLGDSQPLPDIVWFQDNSATPLDESLTGTIVRFLEGGRWAYITDIETFSRDYRCGVRNARMHELVRSPQTYFVNGTGLVNGMDFVYKEIGDLTAYRCELLSDSEEFAQETFVFCSKLIYRQYTHTPHTHTHTHTPHLPDPLYSRAVCHKL